MRGIIKEVLNDAAIEYLHKRLNKLLGVHHITRKVEPFEYGYDIKYNLTSITYEKIESNKFINLVISIEIDSNSTLTLSDGVDNQDNEIYKTLTVTGYATAHFINPSGIQDNAVLDVVRRVRITASYFNIKLGDVVIGKNILVSYK
jgi:hypothetical protein